MIRTPPSTPNGYTPATRQAGGKIFLVLALLCTLLVSGVLLLRSGMRKLAPLPTGESAQGSGFTAKQLHFEAVPEKLVVAAVTKKDDFAEQLAALRKAIMDELARMQGEIDALKNRKTSATPIVQSPAEKKDVVKPPAQPPLALNRDIKAVSLPTQAKPEYVLAPGAGKIPCVIETVINSDVEGFFTAKVTTNVYDTRTGRHLLVPQGSTILARALSETLLYGNERIPSTSLTLTLPDGRTVELGQAPVTDQRGTMGLTGDVNNHFWRLFGAVFIGGALRGGAIAAQAAAANAGGAGYVVSGIGAAGSDAVGRQMGRAMDTRPTITVAAGQLCNILLIKPLQLTAMWE